ncbi:hypothetical protein C8R46DRAFT_1350910, partial [Mycena filopes]
MDDSFDLLPHSFPSALLSYTSIYPRSPVPSLSIPFHLDIFRESSIYVTPTRPTSYSPSSPLHAPPSYLQYITPYLLPLLYPLSISASDVVLDLLDLAINLSFASRWIEYIASRRAPALIGLDRPDCAHRGAWALGMIEDDSDPTISAQKLDVLVAYLDFKHVSDSTKLYVLEYLGERSWASEHEARIMVDGQVLPRILNFFNSPNLNLSSAAVVIFRNVTQYPSVMTAVLDIHPCRNLVALVLQSMPKSSDEHVRMERRGLVALCCLAEISGISEDGARAVLDADVLPLLQTTLLSGWASVRGVSSWMVGRIARHDSLRSRVPVEQMLPSIVLCLRFPLPDLCGRLPEAPSEDDLAGLALHRVEAACLAVDCAVFLRCTVSAQRAAICALADISGASFEGGKNVLDAHVLSCVPGLLGAKDADVLYYTCMMLGRLAEHKSLRLIISVNTGADVCGLLPTLFNHEDRRVREAAIYASSHINQTLWHGMWPRDRGKTQCCHLGTVTYLGGEKELKELIRQRA